MLTVARGEAAASLGDGFGVGYGPADVVLPPTEPIAVPTAPAGR
ncbi:hypothetical protein [Microbacterium dextranolyticum]|nr:hypothetical protein [Microbacterium dextranolyticum]MBM7463460.1 hypothetical protein [Microbacterium dextranolyticum]